MRAGLVGGAGAATVPGLFSGSTGLVVAESIPDTVLEVTAPLMPPLVGAVVEAVDEAAWEGLRGRDVLGSVILVGVAALGVAGRDRGLSDEGSDGLLWPLLSLFFSFFRDLPTETMMI